MDDLKLYGSNQNETDSLITTVEVVTKDIGMKFGIDKCNVLGLKRGKEFECNGIELIAIKLLMPFHIFLRLFKLFLKNRS